MSNSRLAGRIALVTGGTRGIGLSIVKAFLGEGARVAFSGTSAQTVARAQSELGREDECAGIVAELSAADAASQLVDSAIKRSGGIDVLVNNAGVISPAGVWDVNPAQWDALFNVNLRAVFFLSQAAARLMRGRGGSIINVSSIAGQNGGFAGQPPLFGGQAPGLRPHPPAVTA